MEITMTSRSWHTLTRAVARPRPAAVRLLRLAPRVRPQSRLELALCAAFRCQPVWWATALVDRLAFAPADSASGLATQNGSLPSADALLGRDAARRALEIWLARGLLAEATPTDPAPVLI